MYSRGKYSIFCSEGFHGRCDGGLQGDRHANLMGKAKDCPCACHHVDAADCNREGCDTCALESAQAAEVEAGT